MPQPIIKTAFDEREAQLSPDNRWLAFASNESGRFEVYVQPFPSAGGKYRISPSGGSEPRWRADGAELFYVGPDRKLMALAISTGATFSSGQPAVVVDARISDSAWWDYAVTPDGQQFIIKQTTNEGRSSPLNVVLDWSVLVASAR
jgi:hypothetical protein